jgi:hypothetical protein
MESIDSEMVKSIDSEMVKSVDRIAIAFRSAHQAQAKAACSSSASKILAGLGREIAALQERIRMTEAVVGDELRAIPSYESAFLDLAFCLADTLDIVREAQSSIKERIATRNRAQHLATAAVLEICQRAGIPISKGNEGIAAQILDYVFRAGGYHITEPRKWIASAVRQLPSPISSASHIVFHTTTH